MESSHIDENYVTRNSQCYHVHTYLAAIMITGSTDKVHLDLLAEVLIRMEHNG